MRGLLTECRMRTGTPIISPASRTLTWILFFFLKKSLLRRKNVMKGFETSELEVTERDKLRVRPSTRAPTVLAVLEQMVGHKKSIQHLSVPSSVGSAILFSSLRNYRVSSLCKLACGKSIRLAPPHFVFPMSGPISCIRRIRTHFFESSNMSEHCTHGFRKSTTLRPGPRDGAPKSLAFQ